MEVLAGMSFGEFLRQRLSQPLDMRHTSFYVGKEKQGRLAQLYKPKGVSATNFLARAVEPGLEVADSLIAATYSQPPNSKVVEGACCQRREIICGSRK